MGLFDDLLEEDELTQQPVQPQSQSRKGGLFDDLLEEDDVAIATPAYQHRKLNKRLERLRASLTQLGTHLIHLGKH